MGNEKSKTGLSFNEKTHFWGVVVLIVVVLGLIVDTIKADSDTFYASIIRLDNVATRIHQNYVEEINAEDLIDNAIKGMIEVLDPHTSFFKQKDYENLRIQTEGKFGGLGIQISIRDKVLTVMTPIAGTPASRAGVQSGDQIIEINGEPTKGITIDNAVAKLRGEPGTDVGIKIRRRGEAKVMNLTITREIITIKSVPFSGVLDNNIGYISLLTFSQEAGDEIKKSIKTLLDQKIEGLILDLRHNPGGLLPQAIEVAEKFLPRKALVVSTRGKVRAQNKDYRASAAPVLPADLPLVVLVDKASASASEIVAGAIQDWDRGVVMGDTTFGKGSVQTILPLDKDHHLKLTTAFYYTPSGRCINKPEHTTRNKNREEEEEIMPDENYEGAGEEEEQKIKNSADAQTKDSSVVADTLEYKTNKGRIVYGGGGIIPDTLVKQATIEPIIRSLFLKDVFFKFANYEYPKLQKKTVALNPDFVVDKKTMDDFYAFIDSIEYKYESHIKIKLDELRNVAGFVKDSVKDSLPQPQPAKRNGWVAGDSLKLADIFNEIEKILAKQEKNDFAKNDSLIRKYVREAILVRGLGSDNDLIFRSRLADDNQVAAAINVLSDKKRYAALLQLNKK